MGPLPHYLGSNRAPENHICAAHPLLHQTILGVIANANQIYTARPDLRPTILNVVANINRTARKQMPNRQPIRAVRSADQKITPSAHHWVRTPSIHSLPRRMHTILLGSTRSNLYLSRSEPPAPQPVKLPVCTGQRHASCYKPDTSSVSESVNHHSPYSNIGESHSAINRYCRNHEQQLRHSSPASIDDLEDIANKAFRTTKLADESNVEAHLRIGTILAAEAQLEEIYLHRFSQCLIGDIKINPSETTPTTTADSSSAAATTPSSAPPNNDSDGEFDRSYTVSDAECVDMTQTTDEETDIPDEPPKPSIKTKRRFRGHGWASKGTKNTRRKARLASKSKHADTTYTPKTPSHSNSKRREVYFTVPYHEREQAKQMGAKWDRYKKLWYADNLRSVHEMEQHWMRAVTRTRAKISTDNMSESSPVGISLMPSPLYARNNDSSTPSAFASTDSDKTSVEKPSAVKIPLMPTPLHIETDKPAASSTSKLTNADINSTVARREMSINEQNLQEYKHFASQPNANPPPFVPVCDFDINKLGLERMQRWLQQQRRDAAFPSDTNNGPDEDEYYRTSNGARLYTDEDCIDFIRKSDIGRLDRFQKECEEARKKKEALALSGVMKELEETRKKHELKELEEARTKKETITFNSVTSKVFEETNATVVDITDHASKSGEFIKRQAAGTVRSDTETRRARATYAWADGMHTTLHYPHEFHVSLHGEPIINETGEYEHPALSGDVEPSAAISAVLDSTNDLTAHPRSLCNHRGCIYNSGDAITRRNHHIYSIQLIDTSLGNTADDGSNTISTPSEQEQNSTTSHPEQCLAASSSTKSKTVVDSGSSRHIETRRASLSNVSKCPPVVLQGINGQTTKIVMHGSAGNCHNVLLAPTAAANVRSVSALTDSHNLFTVFTHEGTYLVEPFDIPPDSHKIAKRKEDGLFHLVRGSIPAAQRASEAHTYLSVAQQIKREAIHHLHRVLAHASPHRMRQTLTSHPEIAPSLKPNDVRLFTNCDACAWNGKRQTSGCT